jgi:hypothetical protein
MTNLETLNLGGIQNSPNFFLMIATPDFLTTHQDPGGGGGGGGP